jgi:glucosylceramidase
MLGSSWPDGLSVDPAIRSAWAMYIKKWIDAYDYKGVPIWAVTPQNEPEFPAPWEACVYDIEGQKNFINSYLGPTLRQFYPKIKILAFDHNKDHILAWAQTLLSPEAAMPDYVDGMAFHWYGGLDRLADGTYGYNELNLTHHAFPDKILLGTEGCSCPGVQLDSWFRAERLAHDVMFDLQNHAAGWIDWNLLVDAKGGPNHLGNDCDASIVLDEKDDELFHVQPKFFYFGHFSKFVPPDSVRVESTIVGDFNFDAEIDPEVTGNLEIGMYGCEHSTRQTWEMGWFDSKKDKHDPRIKMKSSTRYTLDLDKGPHKVDFCLARGFERDFIRLVDCNYTDDYTYFIEPTLTKHGQLLDESSGMCLTLSNGAFGPGALLSLDPCSQEMPVPAPTPTAPTSHTSHTSTTASTKSTESSSESQDNPPSETSKRFPKPPSTAAFASQKFAVNSGTGEITTNRIDPKGLTSGVFNLCLTAGWPFMSAVAFVTPHEKDSPITIEGWW